MSDINLIIGAFIEKNGKVLLLKEGGKWNIPVSHLDKGTNILEDLKMNMKKITGLDVEAEAVSGVYEDPGQVRIFFKTKLLGGKAKTGKWFTYNEIQKMTAEETGPIMNPFDDYRLEKFVPLDFIKKFKGL